MEIQVNRSNNKITGSEQIDPGLVKETGGAHRTFVLPTPGCEEWANYAEEWQIPAIMPDGRKCYKMYFFTQNEINDIEPESYPWDDEHAKIIILATDEESLCDVFIDDYLKYKNAIKIV